VPPEKFSTFLEQISSILLTLMYRSLNLDELRGTVKDDQGEFEVDLEALRHRDISDSSELPPRALDTIVEHLKLRKYLKAVRLPQRNPETGQIQPLFTCLKRKGVRRIETLVVDELVYRPHSDEAVGEAIEGLEIGTLDWRKTDMCSTVLARARKLERVYLYTSGNNAVLRSWSAPDGLLSVDSVSTYPNSSFAARPKGPMAVD
jgi:hypothetical protein